MRLLLQQKYAWCDKICSDKIRFVATKYFFHEKAFVTTNIMLTWQVLLQQAYFCHDKRHVLSWQTHVCRDKTFVATKIILVAAPTSDRNWFSLLVAKGSNCKQLFVSGCVFCCCLLRITCMCAIILYSVSELMEMYGCMYSISDTNWQALKGTKRFEQMRTALCYFSLWMKWILCEVSIDVMSWS